MVGAVLATVVVVALILVISIGTSGQSSAHGCIYATIPGPVGAQQVNQCGAQARDTCRSASTPGSFTPQAARVIEAQCRKAGLPIGPSG
jgi:hypothetical protein